MRKESTKLSLTRQCKLLKISRLSIYYTQVGRIQRRLSWCMRLIGCLPNTRYSEVARLRLTLFSRASQPGEAVFNARWTSWDYRPSIMDRTPLRSTQITAFAHTCWGSLQSRGPIRFGAASSTTSPSRAAFCIWWCQGLHLQCRLYG